jgi:hypothetical protein
VYIDLPALRHINGETSSALDELSGAINPITALSAPGVIRLLSASGHTGEWCVS